MIKSSLNKVNRNGSLMFITFKSLEKFSELSHLFSTRLGGVSKGYFGTMNLGLKLGDQRSDVIENYKILCEQMGSDISHLVLSDQTHTNNVLVVDKSNCGSGILRESDFCDVDGLITDCAGVALVTQSADCCLLAFYDPEKRVIAASHAGWRGTVAEIGKNTVLKMQQTFGCNPENIVAAIMPSICRECYEVDTPVYSEFEKLKHLDLNKIFTAKGGGKYQLDLWEANRQILCAAGLKNENIELTDICTNCQSEFLHSHRATAGRRGVNALIMEIKE